MGPLLHIIIIMPPHASWHIRPTHSQTNTLCPVLLPWLHSNSFTLPCFSLPRFFSKWSLVSLLHHLLGHFKSCPCCLRHNQHVPATDGCLLLGSYYGAHRPLGFLLVLAQERHCSPSSNTPDCVVSLTMLPVSVTLTSLWGRVVSLAGLLALHLTPNLEDQGVTL